MSSGVPIQPQDRRGYFMLPQAPEGAGYYVYGNVDGVPGTGHLGQYAHPDLLSYIFAIEREWQTICDRKFGIGNISIDGGSRFPPHSTHRKGIEMDCRPVRKDHVTGPGAIVSYGDPHYDLDATIALLSLIARHPETRIIFFNDVRVQKAIGGGRVRTVKNHNDHFHVEIKRR